VGLDKILYFPSISVPRSTWTYRALLYWDEIGTIMPLEYLDMPESLESFMKDLTSAELVTRIHPGQYIYEIPRFREAFLNYIEGNSIIQSIVQKEKSPDKYVQIHLEKMQGLENDFMEMGLAVRGAKPNWFYVEANTGFSFMTYLAAILGSVTDFQPSTDELDNLSTLAESSSLPNNINKYRDKLRLRILENILPAPVKIDNVYELVKFKEKYNSELRRFRNEVEYFLMDLETVPKNQVDERINRFIQEKRDEMDYITSKMKEHKWRFLNLVTIMSVASTVIPMITATDAIGRLASVPGLLAAIGSALSNNQIKQIRNHPLAYAILARGLKG